MNPRLKALERLLVANSPTILTGVAVAGLFTTSYLSGRAGYQAAQRLAEESPYLTTKEQAHATWRLYLPAATSGTITAAAIISANRVGVRRAAALAAAYSLSNQAYSEYREAVEGVIGVNKERDIRDQLASSRVARAVADSSPTGHLLVAKEGTQRCFDSFSGQLFTCDQESIRRAVNDVNARLLDEGYISLTEFYSEIGLPQTTLSESVGWQAPSKVDLNFTSTLLPDGYTYLTIDFKNAPVTDYYRYS